MPSLAASLDSVPMVLSASATLTVSRASCIAGAVTLSTPHHLVGGTSMPREMMLLVPVVQERIHMNVGSIHGFAVPFLPPCPKVMCAASALITLCVDAGGVASTMG